MCRPSRQLRDGEVPPDLRHPTPLDLFRCTFAAVGEHTGVHPNHHRATARVATGARFVTGTPLARSSSRAVQR